MFFQTDAERGYALIPNAAGWFWPERKSYVRINSDGFRDREHTKAKAADTIRIAVLGDSYADARHIPIDQTFWGIIEQDLRRSGKNVEVLNFGVSGYGTVEELLTLRQRVWEYSPDIVVLTVTTYNDITDNYRPFKRAEELPYFILQDGKLVLDNSFLQSKKYRWNDSATFKAWTAIHNHSRLIQLLHHAQFAIRTRLSERKEAQRLAELQKQHDDAPTSQSAPTTASMTDLVGLPNMIYREPDDADWDNAWKLTEQLITQMRDETIEHGGSFMMATVTADIQVYPDPAVRKNLMDRIAVTDLFYPDRRLRSLAEREGFAFVDLAEPMQQAADRDHIFFHGFDNDLGNGHWNEAGHRFAGELMAAKLAEIISN
jgi:lysophospholipase L1-like esterase